MAPPFALPPPEPPLPAYVRQAESGLLMPDQRLRKAVLPGLIMPPGFFAAEVELTSLSLVGSNTSTNSGSVTAPSGIADGDLLILCDFAADSARTPSGFTTAINTIAGGVARQIVSYKVANGTESGQSLSGMVNNTFAKVICAFRASKPLNSAAHGGTTSSTSVGTDPASRTINASGGTPPLLVVAAYGAFLPGGDIDPRTFDPPKDGDVGTNTSGRCLYLAWKFYGANPQNTTIDFGEPNPGGETYSILQGCYIELG